MEDQDRAAILQAAEVNPRLARLYDSHRRFEKRLRRYATRGFLTTEEELEEKTLKRKKLRGVEEMFRILRRIKSETLPAKLKSAG